MSDENATTYPAAIAEAIAKVMGADLYVQKRGKNAFHGYKYATVGDLLDKLQPLMAEAGLVILQDELSSDFLDGGNVLATRYRFTLAHASGAVWPEKPVHTGMSTCRNSKGGFDDKAANKCHTAARKYFLLGLFQVPTGEDYREATHDGDADGSDHAQPPRTNGVTRVATAPMTSPPVGEHDGGPAIGEPPPNIAKFLARPSYEIDPSKIGWQRWQSSYLAIADAATELEQILKLENDNGAHFAGFRESCAEPVYVSFRKRIEANEARLWKEPSNPLAA